MRDKEWPLGKVKKAIIQVNGERAAADIIVDYKKGRVCYRGVVVALWSELGDYEFGNMILTGVAEICGEMVERMIRETVAARET